MSWRVEQADCLDAMRRMDEASVDAIVTDPPYGLEFMGKEWDRLWNGTRKAKPEGYVGSDGVRRKKTQPMSAAIIQGAPTYEGGIRAQEWHHAWATEALRVLKPGGHLLAAGGTRTFHRLVVAIEDAGFEIRDCIAHMYGSGFPKSHNGEWGGTALKPGFEPWTLARKPLIGTVEANWKTYGTGALNIEGCRIEGQPHAGGAHGVSIYGSDGNYEPGPNALGNAAGRWPANVTLSPEAAEELDRQSGEVKPHGQPAANSTFGGSFGNGQAAGPNQFTDSGGAARFFYQAKASRAERNAGLDGFPSTKSADDGYGSIQEPKLDRATPRENWTPHRTANHHPTVKPIDLMRWLVRLVTPPDGTVLDPFTGSGTTGCAAVLEGFDFIGTEREAEYVEIARARIDYWAKQPKQLGLLGAA